MKQCVSIVNLENGEFDGELCFSIVESDITADCCTMTLGAQDEGAIVGFKVEIPIITKKMAFRAYQMICPAGKMKFSSIGEKSDAFVRTFKKFFTPSYEVSDGFTSGPVEVDYVLQNKGAYDLNQDKMYLRMFYDETQDEDLPKNERVHFNMTFSFNLSRETASIIERETGYSADFLCYIME